MPEAFICAALRTPIGRYGGSLSSVRTDDLGAVPLKALMERHASVDWAAVDDVIFGCANQAGEDNRNVARMALLLAGLPQAIPGSTVNRLCGSGMDPVGIAARAIRAGEAELMIAGGVESMSRAPFVMPKAESAFSRSNAIFDTTIGWRFVNPAMHKRYGTESMPETAENVAADYNIARDDQDAMALRSQARAATAQKNGRLAKEIVPVTIPSRKGDPVVVSADEHPRETSMEALGKLKPVVKADGTVTAGNAAGINDGAAAVLLADAGAVRRYGLQPLARLGMAASAGVAPRVMGLGPLAAAERLRQRNGLAAAEYDVIELNEAFAAQVLACTRGWGLPDDANRVNARGGSIAMGHPLGMTGARIAGTAARRLAESGGRTALVTLCVGVGQGVALALHSV
jgi:acetyl-CoA acyltransferase